MGMQKEQQKKGYLNEQNKEEWKKLDQKDDHKQDGEMKLQEIRKEEYTTANKQRKRNGGRIEEDGEAW